MLGINCMKGCEVVLVGAMGGHGSIPKVNTSMQICVTKLEVICPVTIVALDVWLSPTIPVGIKHYVWNERNCGSRSR